MCLLRTAGVFLFFKGEVSKLLNKFLPQKPNIRNDPNPRRCKSCSVALKLEHTPDRQKTLMTMRRWHYWLLACVHAWNVQHQRNKPQNHAKSNLFARRSIFFDSALSFPLYCFRKHIALVLLDALLKMWSCEQKVHWNANLSDDFLLGLAG